jgi:hypothetical protein
MRLNMAKRIEIDFLAVWDSGTDTLWKSSSSPKSLEGLLQAYWSLGGLQHMYAYRRFEQMKVFPAVLTIFFDLFLTSAQRTW